MTQAEALRQNKYSDPKSRDTYRAREELALHWLHILGLDDVEKVGNGTGSSEVLSTWHTGLENKFDFYSKRHNLFFEATGTDWEQERSARRMGKPTLAVLKVKVDDAIDYNIDDRLIFVGVWDKEQNPLDKVRFMPCPNVRWYSLCHYAEGEKPYYAIPWADWLKPGEIVPTILKAKVEGGR